MTLGNQGLNGEYKPQRTSKHSPIHHRLVRPIDVGGVHRETQTSPAGKAGRFAAVVLCVLCGETKFVAFFTRLLLSQR